MRKILKILGVIVGILLIGAAAFYFAFLRGLPRPEIALQPIRFTGMEMPDQHDCFWIGPVTIDAFNTAYPDEGAIYWPTVFKFPTDEADSHLEITGKYPEARYMSYHSYTEGSAPYDHLNDIGIVPDSGTQNPFITGSFAPDQTYTIKVYPREQPETAPANTLYLGSPDKISSTPIILRNYVSEIEGDPSGGAGLPEVVLVRANGDRVEGETLCALLNSPPVGDPDRYVSAPVIPREVYDKMIHNREVRDSILKTKQEEWIIFWGPRVGITRLMSPALSGMIKKLARWGVVKKTSGFFANFDNEYVSMYITEEFGEITVLKGKLPLTPATGAAGADVSGFDMRYWSLCTNEGLATTRFTDCVYDSKVTVDEEQNYTIVISKPGNRPANATEECGVTWMDFGEKGDGAGNEMISILILRNMLHNPGFTHAVQNIPRVGDEKLTMGAYLPIPEYTDQASFEARGCKP